MKWPKLLQRWQPKGHWDCACSQFLRCFTAVFYVFLESCADCCARMASIPTLSFIASFNSPESFPHVLAQIAAQAAAAGTDSVVLEIMDERCHSGPLLRQACMVVRNMAVRNPELRAPLLAKGAEEKLRTVKAAHSKVGHVHVGAHISCYPPHLPCCFCHLSCFLGW